VGDGSGLTGLNFSQIAGAVSAAQLPPEAVTNTQTGVTLSGAFSGDGGGLTGGSYLSAYDLSSQFGSSSSPPALSFGFIESKDGWSPAPDPDATTFTCPATGLYSVQLTVTVTTGTASSYAIFTPKLNGTSLPRKALAVSPAVSPGFTTGSRSFLLNANAGDTLSFLFAASSSDVNISTAAIPFPLFVSAPSASLTITRLK
jgi:hypothetical protein